MRRTAILGVLLLPLAVALAGCGRTAHSRPSPAAGGASGPPVASAAAGADQDALLKFAHCMREHGMTWFPVPSGPGEEQPVDLPPGVSAESFEAAQQACREFAQEIVKGPVTNAASTGNLRLMAQCMRENGVAGFPDPDADGSLMVDADKLSVKTDSPVFQAAEKACRQYQAEETR